jgi:hypothetical protein
LVCSSSHVAFGNAHVLLYSSFRLCLTCS